MSGRATPNHCPFCGDDNLWPHLGDTAEGVHNAWECRSCLRAFNVSMIKQLPRPVLGVPAGSGGTP